MKNPNWGSKEWFDKQFDSSVNPDIDGWKIGWRASQSIRFDIYDKIIKPIIEKSTNLRLLEIGCALGDYTLRLQKINPNNFIIGVDISHNAISRVSRIIPDVDFQVGSLPELIFEEESFDGIFCLEVLYYLDYYNQRRSLAILKTLLKKDGFILLSGGINQGLRYFDEKEIIRQISDFFSIYEINYNYSKLYNILEKRSLYFLEIFKFLEKLSNISKKEFLEVSNNSKYFNVISYWYKLSHFFPYGSSFCRKTVKFGIILIRGILSSKSLVKICFVLSKLFLGENGKTQIIILAFKRNNHHG